MVRTRGNRGRGVSSQGPQTPTPPLPSLGLALIFCSLVVINEILKGHQSIDVEVDPLPSGMGNPEASRDSEGGPLPEDITRKLQKIKLP
jgi:hypothetical protein